MQVLYASQLADFAIIMHKTRVNLCLNQHVSRTSAHQSAMQTICRLVSSRITFLEAVRRLALTWQLEGLGAEGQAKQWLAEEGHMNSSVSILDAHAVLRRTRLRVVSRHSTRRSLVLWIGPLSGCSRIPCRILISIT
jgi:hypothetical protein